MGGPMIPKRLEDVLDRVLDKGIVVDDWQRVYQQEGIDVSGVRVYQDDVEVPSSKENSAPTGGPILPEADPPVWTLPCPHCHAAITLDVKASRADG
jgi:hypothetical protein